MGTLRQFSAGVSLAAVVALLGAPAIAQTCDYQIVSATWSPHANPDSIYVDFAADVLTDMPLSPDPQNPTEFPMTIAIRFNGAPLGDQHPMTLKWWHGITCTAGCPPNICEEKAWTFKGGEVRDQSRCTLNPQNVCGCPKIGDPVVEHKAVPKPPGSGVIEVEIVALSLVSCNPIKPENDRKQFSYPGGGGSVPGAGVRGMGALTGALALMALVAIRRRAVSADSQEPRG
jgi:hypothetical protein